jgi:hypothetical protein
LKIPIGSLPRSEWDALWFYDFNVLAQTTVPRILPIPKYQTWRVIQEFDANGGSHVGDAAFNWDCAGPTADSIFTAATSGKVNYVEQCANGKVHIRVQDTDEVDAYIHTKASSFEQIFMIPQDLFLPPDPYQPSSWLSVALGQQLARTDIEKAHLHFGANHKPGYQTAIGIPAAFRNYQTSNDGVSWSSTILYGLPRSGSYIRRVE